MPIYAASFINRGLLALLRLCVQVLMSSLQDQPHIAYRVCDAIGRLAEGFKEFNGAHPVSHPYLGANEPTCLAGSDCSQGRQPNSCFTGVNFGSTHGP